MVSTSETQINRPEVTRAQNSTQINSRASCSATQYGILSHSSSKAGLNSLCTQDHLMCAALASRTHDTRLSSAGGCSRALQSKVLCATACRIAMTLATDIEPGPARYLEKFMSERKRTTHPRSARSSVVKGRSIGF